MVLWLELENKGELHMLKKSIVFLALSSLFVLSACSDDAINAYVVKVSDIVELHGEIDSRERFE